ncbi:hypothetical protein HMPREF0972_01153 [Actinomyces sp. oral taxon 848 str. F0332]|nr:hypothetical protein HMPREF0972_01153 [Actinomyces sp. oral taxon 848 str. F0332]
MSFAGMGYRLELSLTLDSVAVCAPGHERSCRNAIQYRESS